MPLLPKEPETCPVVVDNEDGTQDTYHIRKWVNARQFAETSAALAEMQLHYTKGTAAAESSVLRSAMIDMMEAQQRMVTLWLVRWSHGDEINPESIERMPLPHVQAVVRAIMERNQAQAGVTESDPLAATSGSSSAGATPGVTPTSPISPPPPSSGGGGRSD